MSHPSQIFDVQDPPEALVVVARINARLYGTESCHLCVAAEAILHLAGIAAIKIDIAADENLLGNYSLRIPVLQRIDNDAELDWPFDAAAAARFLK
jgi:hypothetical protein